MKSSIFPEQLQKRSIIQEILDPVLETAGVRLLVKRDDLIHQHISGNKWRKLKYNLEQARSLKQETILTFGGAYSNHIHAVSAAGAEYGFRTIGIIRGEAYDPLNPTLEFAQKQGMHLHYVSRQNYKSKYQPEFLVTMKEVFGEFYLVPEGGSNPLAVKGCTEIINEIDVPYDVITACCGTGGTLAGIIGGLNGQKEVIGFSVLKGGTFLYDTISELTGKSGFPTYNNWHIATDYHFGGYAKFKPELIKFINRLNSHANIPLDPVYTGKMFFGLFDMIKKGYFSRGAIVLAIHTGGLQGIKGFNQRFGDIIK